MVVAKRPVSIHNEGNLVVLLLSCYCCRAMPITFSNITKIPSNIATTCQQTKIKLNGVCSTIAGEGQVGSVGAIGGTGESWSSGSLGLTATTLCLCVFTCFKNGNQQKGIKS